MRIDLRPTTIVLSGTILMASLHGAAQRGTGAPADATAKIVAAAQAVLASLDEAGRAKVQFRFDDAAQKARWSNLPSPMFRRVGLRLGDLTPPQRAAVTALLQTALSADGYRKVTEIMRGDEVLKTTGGGRGPRGGGPPPGGAPGGPPAGGPPPGGQGRGGGGGGGG